MTQRPRTGSHGVAFLGYGWVNERHARAAAAAGADLVVVAGPSAERAEIFARRHAVETSTADWQLALEDRRVDAVVVGTPNALHAEQAIAALRAGKHVLVDKPMATSDAEAAAMADAAASADRLLLVGHMFRYREELRSFQARVGAREFGRIRRTTGWGCHLEFGPSGWFLDRSLSGGGALIDLGIHAIDSTRFVLGEPVPLLVEASLSFDPEHPGIDTSGTVMIEWESGVRSRIEVGWWQPKLDGLIADVEVVGTKGAGRVWPPPPPPPGYEHGDEAMYSAQMTDFLARCQDGFDPAACEPGRAALAIALAAYRAAANGFPEHVPR